MNKGFYKKYFELEKSYWLLRGRRKIVDDQLLRFNPFPPEKTVILDYGCASGLLVGELAKRGFNAYGLDISEEAIEFGKSQGVKNLRVIDPDIHKIDFPGSFFDVILVLDVFEHLEDESWTLKEIYKVLKPGGIVISMVPAYTWMWSFHDKLMHHLRRYTLGRYLDVIKKSGPWEILRSSYFNTILFIPITLVRIVTRIFNLNGRESDFDINTKPMNKILGWIFGAERLMLKHFDLPLGVSILSVFKKPEDENISNIKLK